MISRETWAIVPVKRFSESKLRLSSLLSETQRAALTKSMLEDLLDELRAVPQIDVLCVASDEPSLHDSGLPCLVLHDPTGATLSGAVQHAVDYAVQHGAGTCCVLHADLPFATSTVVLRLLRRHRTLGSRGVTLVSDRAHDGTNAIVCSPGDVLEFRYGENSLAAHRSFAERSELAVDVVGDGALDLDIDTPDDLQTLTALVRGAGPRTRALLHTLPLQHSAGSSA